MHAYLRYAVYKVAVAVLPALTKTLMSVQSLVGYISHSASVHGLIYNICYYLELHDQSVLQFADVYRWVNIRQLSPAKSAVLAYQRDGAWRRLVTNGRDCSWWLGGHWSWPMTQFGEAVCGYALALYDFAAVCWLQFAHCIFFLCVNVTVISVSTDLERRAVSMLWLSFFFVSRGKKLRVQLYCTNIYWQRNLTQVKSIAK